MYLVVALLVIPEPHLHPPLDIRGREKHDAAFVLQAVVQVNEVVEHSLRQLVRLVKQQHSVLRLDQLRRQRVQHVPDRHAVRPEACLLGDVTDEVAPMHVLRAQDVVGSRVVTLILTRSRRLPAAGFTHHPRHVLPLLGVRHRIRHLLRGSRLHRLPRTRGGSPHLRAYLLPHLVADVLPLAAQYRAHRARTRPVQARGGLVLALVLQHIEAQSLSDLFFLFLVHIVFSFFLSLNL